MNDRTIKKLMLHLEAAISLAKGGGVLAAPSNKMFEQMIADYEETLEQAKYEYYQERDL